MDCPTLRASIEERGILESLFTSTRHSTFTSASTTTRTSTRSATTTSRDPILDWLNTVFGISTRGQTTGVGTSDDITTATSIGTSASVTPTSSSSIFTLIPGASTDTSVSSESSASTGIPGGGPSLGETRERGNPKNAMIAGILTPVIALILVSIGFCAWRRIRMARRMKNIRDERIPRGQSPRAIQALSSLNGILQPTTYIAKPGNASETRLADSIVPPLQDGIYQPILDEQGGLDERRQAQQEERPQPLNHPQRQPGSLDATANPFGNPLPSLSARRLAQILAPTLSVEEIDLFAEHIVDRMQGVTEGSLD
ncbi:hypothetical protein FRC17_004892, partial [Serendipita sp. 399]